jgi:SOS response regulatory protein OraA/RecX
VVEAGIERADQLGPERAAEYLSHRGVAESVIKRVISEPEHRRNPAAAARATNAWSKKARAPINSFKSACCRLRRTRLTNNYVPSLH